MKRIDFNDKLTKLIDEAYNEIVKILKTLDYDKEDGFNIFMCSDSIEAIRVCPNYENVLEYRLEDDDEWYSDWYEGNLIDIITVYDALCDTLDKAKEEE